jgi:CHAT domain-containing protein
MMRLLLSSAGLALVLGVAGGAIAASPVQPVAQASEVERKKAEADRLVSEGFRLIEQKQNSKALNIFKNALEIYQAVRDMNGEAYSLYLIALYSPKSQERNMNYEKSLSIYRKLKNRNREVSILRLLGTSYEASPQATLAVQYYKDLLAIYEENKDEKDKAWTLSRLANTYSLTLNHEQLVSLAKTALPLFQKNKHRDYEGSLLKKLGASFKALSQYEESIVHHTQALEIFRALKDAVNEAQSLNGIGEGLTLSSQPKKSMLYHAQALKIFRQLKDQQGEAWTLNGIGRVQAALAQYQDAIASYSQANLIFKSIGDDKGFGATLHNLGTVYSKLGLYKKSIENYEGALFIFRKNKNLTNEGTALGNLAVAHQKIGVYDKSIAFHKQAIQIFDSIQDIHRKASAESNLGFVYQIINDYENAKTYYNRALINFHSIRTLSDKITLFTRMGKYFLLASDGEQALIYYQKALFLTQESSSPSVKAELFSSLGELFFKQGKMSLATAFYKKAINEFESIKAGIRQLPEDMQTSYSFSVSDSYKALADLLIDQGRFPEAQAVLELLKRQELKDYTRDTTLTPQGITLSPAEEQTLTLILDKYKSIAAFSQALTKCETENCPNLPALRQQRSELNAAIERELDKLRQTLSTQANDPYRVNTEQYTRAARKIVAAQEGTVLIYPLIIEEEKQDRIQFLLAFKSGTQDGITLTRINGPTLPKGQLNRTTYNLRDHLSNPNSDLKKLQTTSQQLYSWFIKPLEPEIQKGIKHLVFANDKATRYIPMGVLHDGKDYLINKPYTITNILSADLTEPQAPRPPQNNLLALGATQFSQAPELPYVGQEIDAIVQQNKTDPGIIPGTEILNDQFSIENLQASLSSSKYNLLHIATHGHLDPSNIDNSYLLPGKGNNITKQVIRDLGNNGLNRIHLVILSACNTAVGTSAIQTLNPNQNNNLELSGLSLYFMQNGAKSVIASLWAVSDPSTALLMQRFYHHFTQGHTKAKALQLAQLDLLNIKDNTSRTQAIKSLPRFPALTTAPITIPKAANHPIAPGYTHPYYWAPFILIGNSL